MLACRILSITCFLVYWNARYAANTAMPPNTNGQRGKAVNRISESNKDFSFVWREEAFNKAKWMKKKKEYIKTEMHTQSITFTRRRQRVRHWRHVTARSTNAICTFTPAEIEMPRELEFEKEQLHISLGKDFSSLRSKKTHILNTSRACRSDTTRAWISPGGESSTNCGKY